MMQLAAPSLGTGLTSVLIGFLIVFIIYLIVIGFVLWLAGEIVVGRRVTFGEALGIAGVGTFLVGAALAFLPGLIGLGIGILVFLLLVKHYFKTSWLGAIGVSIMAIVVIIVIIFILGALALGALFVLPKLPGLQSQLRLADLKHGGSLYSSLCGLLGSVNAQAGIGLCFLVLFRTFLL